MTVFEESRATVELAAHAVGCEPARIAKTLSFDLSALKDKNLWITVCEGDTKAFPGMNEAVARWESLGSKVERNEEFWDSHASPAEINNKAQKMAEAEAPIKYSVFAGGADFIRGDRRSAISRTKSGRPLAYHNLSRCVPPGCRAECGG